jgi:hypothetical protein
MRIVQAMKAHGGPQATAQRASTDGKDHPSADAPH